MECKHCRHCYLEKIKAAEGYVAMGKVEGSPIFVGDTVAHTYNPGTWFVVEENGRIAVQRKTPRRYKKANSIRIVDYRNYRVIKKGQAHLNWIMKQEV